MVPTMFVRMLKLDEDVRRSYDHSSLVQVIHAAAPCPVDVKRAMIEWWGPIISEFYSSSEGSGATFVTSTDWLQHPGTVGKAMLGVMHILDDSGKPVPVGEVGTIWAETPQPFEYLNDQEKTQQQQNEHGWTTVGDVGYLDDDGFLYLTDRKSYMIISGGVNIYPQEAEDVLIGHPKVYDVAVFGVPNPDFGEEVKAVVQPVSMDEAGPELADELDRLLQEPVGHLQVPPERGLRCRTAAFGRGEVVQAPAEGALLGRVRRRRLGRGTGELSGSPRHSLLLWPQRRRIRPGSRDGPSWGAEASMRRTVSRQRPHTEPAPQSAATSLVDLAPRAMAASTIWVVAPVHRHTYIATRPAGGRSRAGRRTAAGRHRRPHSPSRRPPRPCT